MTALRALIIDDERLARSELRRLLAEHGDIEIVGEASNAADANRAIRELEPDLLFLDVQMPGKSGFDLLAGLESSPLVIFTTAFDEYALHAFEVSALDYLLKPIDPARLARAVKRVLELAPATRASVPAPARPLSEHHRVFVSEGERYWLVRLGDIRLFESSGNFTRLYFGSEKPLIHRSLTELMGRLDDRVFFQANRHQIVNLKAVRSIGPWFGGRLMAELEGSHQVIISRRRVRILRQHLSV